MMVGGLVAAELQAKIAMYGWDLGTWPLEVSILSDSPGHDLFFFIFIIPVLFAIYLAIARHAPNETE